MEIKYVSTTCPYCGTGCGFKLVVRDGKAFDAAHRQRSPVSGGKLCPKGRCAHEFINGPDRLEKPLIKKDGEFVEVTWDEAYDLIAEKFGSCKPDEIACLSSARTSNEENCLMQKFARVALRTPTSTTAPGSATHPPSRGLAAVFGSGAMTNSIRDIAESKCVFVLGSNTFEQHPLIGRSIIRAREIRGKVENAMLKLGDKWGARCSGALGEGTERLNRIREQTSRRIKCCSCIENCPICYCLDCSTKKDYPVEPGVIPPPFMFHLIRFAHISDSCVNCGQCEELCPVEISNPVFLHAIQTDLEKLSGFHPGEDMTPPVLAPVEETTGRKRLDAAGSGQIFDIFR